MARGQAGVEEREVVPGATLVTGWTQEVDWVSWLWKVGEGWSYLEYRVAEGEGLCESPQFWYSCLNHWEGGLPFLH